MRNDETQRSRRGRPPAPEAGTVDERVMDAATALFLEKGFGRTTLDGVARSAGIGKSSVYGRYPDKEALFSAVVARSIELMFRDLAPVPVAATPVDRLRHVGLELARSLLVPRCVAFMRITAAEAGVFPNLATMAYRVSFQGSVRCVLTALEPLELRQEQGRVIAERFVEIALQPVCFQAAFGGSPTELRQRAEVHVDDAIQFLRSKGHLPD